MIFLENNKRRKIFFDGEFTRLKTNGIDFLSVAFISDRGNELYLEINQDFKECDDWVVCNVVPYLNQNKVTVEEATQKIKEFVEKEYKNENPILVADVNQFDWIGICKLFGIWDIPFYYIPLDFSTILYAKGIDIDINRMYLAKEYGIDTNGYKQHNALADTRVLKMLWDKLV